MQVVDQDSAGNSALGSPVYWHFRALPEDVRRVTIRRLALSGLRDHEIAARTGLPEETVRRVVSEDECLRTLLLPTPLNSGWLQATRSSSLSN
jgi:hypothetical protein